MKIKLADFLWIFYGVREKWIKRQKKTRILKKISKIIFYLNGKRRRNTSAPRPCKDLTDFSK